MRVDRDEALGGLLVLDEGPLGVVERDRDRGFQVDLRAHPASVGLGAQVVPV